MNSCQYLMATDHETDNARNVHFSNCVRTQMKKMGDMGNCVGYFAEIFSGNDPTKDKCSIKNLQDLCTEHQKTYTINDAEKYCMLEIEAHKQFWKEHYQKEHDLYYNKMHEFN